MSAQGLKYMGIGLTFCGAAHLNYERASVLDSIGSYDTTEAKIGIAAGAVLIVADVFSYLEGGRRAASD